MFARVGDGILQEPHARDPVDHGVVQASGERFATVVERPDHVDRPQRVAVVEGLGHQIPDRAPQVFDRCDGLRVPTDVTSDVEVFRRHPARPVSPGVHPLARPRMRIQTLRDAMSESVEVEGLARLEDQKLQRVAGHGRRLESEDARIILGQEFRLRRHLRSRPSRAFVNRISPDCRMTRSRRSHPPRRVLPRR